MKEPIRIFSDLHLGHRVSRIERVAALRPLFEGAGTVVFNGDTWQEFEGPFHERSAAMLAELRSLCAELGVATVFLSGNHDPGWPGPGFLELAGGKIVATHGDTLFDAGSPWKREILADEPKVGNLWDRHPAAGRDIGERVALARRIARILCSVEYPLGRRFIQRAWDAVLPPQRALRMIECWWRRPQAGLRFLETYFPAAEVLVFGHFHLHGCWRRNGRLIIDSGSFVSPGRAHWLEWNQGWLLRGEVAEAPDEFRLGRRLGVWRIGAD
jgi:predicted phosphodiesterase